MRIFAFGGLRFGAAAGEAGRLAAPPFDQIDDELRDRLHAEPLQFAWLTRPVAADREGAKLDAARAAAARHRSWLAQGVVAREPGPGLYPYELLAADGGRRLGLCCLVGLEGGEAGRAGIQPHERTVEKTVSERLELLRATALDLEPILLLAEDAGGLDALLETDLTDGSPLVEHRDLQGHRHRLFQLGQGQRIDEYRRLLAGCRGLIADGHHRYRVAQRHAEEIGALPGAPAACKLAVVTSVASPGLVIDPIHRGLAAAADLEPAGRLATARRPATARSGGALAAEVADAEQPALAVRLRGGAPEIWHLRRSAGADARAGDRPSGDSAVDGAPQDQAPVLAVELLHADLLPALGLGAEAATDGRVLYRSGADTLWRELEEGGLQAGVWLPPIAPSAFAAAVARGGLMPPKSTRFLPKLVSGLVWAPHDAELA